MEIKIKTTVDQFEKTNYVIAQALGALKEYPDNMKKLGLNEKDLDNVESFRAKMVKAFTNSANQKIDWDKLKAEFIRITGKKVRVVNDKVKRKVKARLNEGYSRKDIINTIENAVKDKYHQETNFRYVTLEYISRGEIIDKYLEDRSKDKEEEKFTPKTETYNK